MSILWTIVAAIGVDQIVKYMISAYFAVHPGSISVVPGVFHLTFVHNTGIAFGMFQGQTRTLMVVILASLVMLAWFVFKQHRLTTYQRISYGLIFGGAVGNIIDRIRVGYVIDFLDFRIWPVFNLADSFISVGVGLLIVEIIWEEFLAKRKNTAVNDKS